MKVKNFIQNIDKVKAKDKLDISEWEDLSIGIMNLISLEEHSYFSYIRTKDDKFLKILETVRELRKKLFSLIVKKDDDSEKWCMSKHFLATSMRLYEVGNRLLHDGKEEQAKEMYKDAAELYGLFWTLNIDSKEKIDIKAESAEGKGVFSSIKKLLECCIE